MPIRTTVNRPTTTPTGPATRTEAVRPPPTRIEWELNAMWRAVRIVEADRGPRQGTGLLKEAPTPGWGVNQDPPVNTTFRDQISPDLKRFLALGTSSLTPYEATRLSFGLGFGGTYHVEPSERAKGYTRGDRVELSVTHQGRTETTRGIVVPGGVLAVDSNDQYHFYAPEYDNGAHGRDKAVIQKVLASALNDGVLESRYGG